MGLDIAADRKEQDQNQKLKAQQKPKITPSPVIIKGVDIPFWDLLIFLVKLALASIPAAIITAVIVSTTVSIAGDFLGWF